MAQELSQAELLDFLCQAGGRVANAALLGHFKRFLRDPRAAPAQLQHRRRLFKGFVNSVATVSQDGPGDDGSSGGGTTYVVLKKRYRDLIGEVEPKRSPPSPPPQQLQRARWDRSGQSPPAFSPRETPRREGEDDGRPSGRRQTGKSPPPDAPGGVGSQPTPPVGCPGREENHHHHHHPRRSKAEPAGLDLQEKAPHSNGLSLPVGEMGPLPKAASVHQRIRDWILTHHEASPQPPIQQPLDDYPVPAWSQSSTSYGPCGSSDRGPGSESSESRRDPPTVVPVFRSIRCRLSLQDLEDHLEQESLAGEEDRSSCASRDSGSHPRGEEAGRMKGCVRNTAGHKGLGDAPHGNGLGMMMPLVQDSKPPPHVALLHRIVGRAGTVGKAEGRDVLKPTARKMGRPPSPNLDAPLSPRLVPRQRLMANVPFVEKLASNPNGPAEHRSSSVPLEGREHTWLVKIATGSWMQVQALLQEDPHLVLHRDFISGFTVLHWLAKHGNVQALQDFVAGAQEAGVILDVNIRSGCGYTPLHLAAIHSHPPIMKILVQKLQCRTQIRDSSGKKAWQYLNANASGEIWQLLGAPRGRTIFPTHPIVRPSAVSSSSTSLVRKVSRKPSLASYLKPHHTKRKKGCKCSVLQEIGEYSD